MIKTIGFSALWLPHKWSSDLKYSPCPPACDWGSRVFGLVFHRIGVAGEEKGEYRTLERIIKDNGHAFTKITFMKMDIEGSELAGLPVWISSGVLKNVKQLAMEVHLLPPQLTNEFFKNIRQLQLRENFRLFSWDPNLCWRNMDKQSDHQHLFEIVMKKIDPLDVTSCCR